MEFISLINLEVDTGNFIIDSVGLKNILPNFLDVEKNSEQVVQKNGRISNWIQLCLPNVLQLLQNKYEGFVIIHKLIDDIKMKIIHFSWNKNVWKYKKYETNSRVNKNYKSMLFIFWIAAEIGCFMKRTWKFSIWLLIILSRINFCFFRLNEFIAEFLFPYEAYLFFLGILLSTVIS